VPDQLTELSRALSATLTDQLGVIPWLTVSYDAAGLADADREAASRGLAVGTVVPFGVLLGGSRLLATLEATHRWRRLTSWIGVDARLTAAAAHLDRVLSLTEPSWATRAVVTLGTASHEATPPAPAELDATLGSAKARYLCFALLDAAAEQLPGFDPAEVLTPGRLATYLAWQDAQARDREATAFMRAWSSGSEDRFRRKTDVTLALDYELVRDVLAVLPEHTARGDR
jgi:hypothetical protein